MKNFVCLLGLVFSFSVAFSQKTYFIYLQTEQKQPFYIKLGDKTYSSSANGYLILSKLIDSSYSITVGFPQNKWPEQKFAVKLGGKDKGFLLKNFQDGSWGLFDLQTLSIQIAAIKAETNSETANVSLFTAILSKAANDPSLMEKPGLIKKEEQPVAVVVKEETKKEELKSVEKVLLDYKRSVITKKSESSTSEGFGLIFIDDYQDGNKDTITIVIPNQDIQRKIIGDTQREKKDINKEIKLSGDKVHNIIDNEDFIFQLFTFFSGKRFPYLKDESLIINC